MSIARPGRSRQSVSSPAPCRRMARRPRPPRAPAAASIARGSAVTLAAQTHRTRRAARTRGALPRNPRSSRRRHVRSTEASRLFIASAACRSASSQLGPRRAPDAMGSVATRESAWHGSFRAPKPFTLQTRVVRGETAVILMGVDCADAPVQRKPRASISPRACIAAPRPTSARVRARRDLDQARGQTAREDGAMTATREPVRRRRRG